MTIKKALVDSQSLIHFSLCPYCKMAALLALLIRVYQICHNNDVFSHILVSRHRSTKCTVESIGSLRDLGADH